MNRIIPPSDPGRLRYFMYGIDLDLWDLTNVVSAPMECDSNKDSVQSNFCVLCRVCKGMSSEESKTIVYICGYPPWILMLQ